jgi:hypothetical protein
MWVNLSMPRPDLSRLTSSRGGLVNYLADFDNFSHAIHARTSEGREKARACGVKLGHKPKLTDHQHEKRFAAATSKTTIDGATTWHDSAAMIQLS